jgi:DNA polymerase V
VLERALVQVIRHRIKQWTGLPVCVGIGTTKTLAKLANRCAKKLPRFDGVCDLRELERDEYEALLSTIDVQDLWGVGARIAAKLIPMGIRTVTQLRDADAATIRDKFGVVLERTMFELRGQQCQALEDVAPARKQIMCSRSFGREVHSFDELRQAIVTYATRAAEKLRGDESICQQIMVFADTNPHKPKIPQYSRQVVVPMPSATDDTVEIVRAAVVGLHKVYRAGFAYNKAGTMLMGLMPAEHRQASLLNDPTELAKRKRLNGTLDQLNRRYGRATVALGGAGMEKRWKLRAENLSPPYTTSWGHLPQVR